MVVNLSPKGLFLGNEEAAKAHRAIVDSPYFKMAMALSMAQYAQGSPSAEALRGVNTFTDILLNLAEKQTDPDSSFPHKALTQPEDLRSQLHESAEDKTPPPSKS